MRTQLNLEAIAFFVLPSCPAKQEHVLPGRNFLRHPHHANSPVSLPALIEDLQARCCMAARHLALVMRRFGRLLGCTGRFGLAHSRKSGLRPIS
ncbi:hypothetical protein M8818_001761 [Zalaria obscura]|uniref:Uncharacterized protein n=1 Tax=Zalaria obscura TaxID=2024903 RepID=A0ACC3SKD7_9PEZI